MRDRLKYQEEQFNFMADALTERCWVCTKLCDDERGCIVAPEAYAGHDVLACSDNHFNRAYEMAMGIKPANRTFYDFARVAERRDEGRGKDYGFRIQEIIFEPNFPPYRRDELSKSLRAETLSDKEYRQLLKEIMLSTQSKGEFEWAVSEIRKLNKKGAETFEASQYPSLKLTENQESKLRWFMFAYEAHSMNEPIYIDEVLGDISPNLWTQATTVGLPFTIEKISRKSIMRNASKASDDENAKRMQKSTLSQLVKKGIFEVNESFENKEVPFTINVKLTPKAEKAVKDDIDDLRSLVAESFEADEKVNERTFLVSVREYDEPVWLIALRDDNDPDYRPMTDEEWKKATQSLPQNFTFRIPIYFSDFAPEWRIITDEVKEKIADETGWFPLYFSIHERLEDGSVVEVEMWSAETFEAKGGKRMYCPNCEKNRTWSSAFKKEKMDHSKGEKPRDFRFYVCQKCDYAYDPKTGKKMEDNWREMFGYDAESFEADCRDCYGTGGLYDSRLGIDDECASCGGTGESFEAEIYDRQGNLRTVDDNFIEATNDKLQALHRLLEANRKQILATNNQDTKTRLREERYRIQDAMARLRGFIDDPINHDGGDFMVRLGAEGYKECCTKDNIRVHHRGGAIYHDDEAELTYYPAECMVCGREYEAGLPMYSSSTEIVKLDAESVSDLELKKDSCCCGATKKTPCVCMILGSDCSAKKPMCACYRLKAIQQKDEKGAETFEARGRKRSGRKKKPKITGMFTRNTDITSRFNPDNPTQGWLKKSCLVVGCDNEVMVQNEMEGKRCLKCYDLMMNERGYYDSTGNGRYVEGEKRPQWMANLMKDSIEDEEDGTYSRYDKGYVAGLFLKSVKDARLNGILKQTNYQDSDLIGSDNRKELRISLNLYEPIALNDPLAEIFGVRIDDSGKYIIFNDTAYNVKIFKSMIGGLPPATKIRISGKPKYPLMFEFDYLTEPYIMFLAPMVFEDSSLNEKIKQHQDFGKRFLRKEKPKISDPNKIPDEIIQQGKDANEFLLINGRKWMLWREETRKIKDSISDEDKEEWFKYTNLKSRDDNNFTMEEIISYYEGILSKYGGNDPDFDPEKADRDNDGEISDWERAVGNAVAKGIREHKERKEAESFGAWDANCSLCNGTGWMPKKGDPKKDAKLAKLLGLSIDELALTPCKAGGKSMGCWSENNSSRLRRLQRAESRPASYMVKSDAHKLNKASKRIHDKADENREYPEWWKSKLSVARNNADQLADFLDYAVVEGIFESEGDHDHEEIDELIDKLNTVVDFAITFVHDGGYGGEPKGILVDEDLGIKTEVVHYIEGSIQLNLVRDINTNELLSVRFSLTGDPDQTPIVYLPLPEEITTVPEDDRVSAKN